MPKISKYENTVCKSCQFGKQSRVQFKEREHSTTQPIELIHTDLSGPTSTQSPRGEIYFIFFIDDYTGMTWVRLLKYKFEAFEKFKIFKVQVENEMELKIKFLRLDRGGSFTFDEFNSYCEKNGIKR
jgi:hypothetical protein